MRRKWLSSLASCFPLHLAFSGERDITVFPGRVNWLLAIFLFACNRGQHAGERQPLADELRDGGSFPMTAERLDYFKKGSTFCVDEQPTNRLLPQFVHRGRLALRVRTNER